MADVNETDPADEYVARLSLKNYPQREFTHEFVAISLRSAFIAGQRAKGAGPCRECNGAGIEPDSMGIYSCRHCSK